MHFLFYFSSYANDQGGDNNGGRRRNGPISFEDILQEILVSITDGTNSGRAPMFFNPGMCFKIFRLLMYLVFFVF